MLTHVEKLDKVTLFNNKIASNMSLMYVCMVRLFVVSCIRSIKDRSRVLTPKLTVVDQRGLITNT